MKDMTLNGDQSGLTRRQLLGLATLTTAGLAAASVGVPQAKAVPKAGEQREPIEDFKHDLEGSEGWVGEGGSAKESTVKQLPVATSIAGISMRSKPGGLRELHWHAIAAEWAYVVKGTVRTTVISPNGNGEAAQDDFGPGDVWFFPKGHGHALQGVGPGETHFVLGFDDGYLVSLELFPLLTGLVTLRRTCYRRISGFPNQLSRISRKQRCTLCRVECRRQNRSFSAPPICKRTNLLTNTVSMLHRPSSFRAVNCT
jgi:oxalate decarboxylase